MQNRGLWVGLAVGVGALQAWDAGALRVGGAAQLLIAAGVLLPAAAIAMTGRQEARLAALVAAALLLLWARLIEPAPLNTLHLSLFVPAFYILFITRLQQNAPRT